MKLTKRHFIISFTSVIILLFHTLNLKANEDWSLGDDHLGLSDKEEIELGEKIDEYIRHEYYFDNDPELNETINKITKKIAAVSERKNLPYTCRIIKTFSVNAFSAPGGHIYVTYGLLQLTKTKDELAGIIGHEIAHASLRHVSKFYKKFKDIFSKQEGETRTAFNWLLLQKHLGEFEQNADLKGVSYAYSAGYDPDGLADFLERQFHRISTKGFLGFNHHMIIGERISQLREYISKLKED